MTTTNPYHIIFNNVIYELERMCPLFKMKCQKNYFTRCDECYIHGVIEERPCKLIYSKITTTEFSDLDIFMFIRNAVCHNVLDSYNF